MIVPDYAPPAALMVAYYASDLLPLFEELAREASRHVGVILLSESPAEAQAFVGRQSHPERFSIVAADHDSPWIRDGSPIAIRTRQGIRWVLPRLPEANRKRDDALFDVVVVREREPAPIRIAGGNVVAGSRGLAVSSAAMLVENDCTAERVRQHAAALIRRWLLFPPFRGEMSGHADVHIRFLRPNVVALAWTPDEEVDQHVSGGLEAMLSRALPHARVVRLPVRAQGKRYASPLNWVPLGRQLLVPTFELMPAGDRDAVRDELEAEGFRVYRSWFLGHFASGNHAAAPVRDESAARTAAGVRWPWRSTSQAWL